MSWFKREAAGPEKKPKPEDSARRVKTEGLWLKCEGCKHEPICNLGHYDPK